MSILSMSITGGVMILAVVLIRALLLERLPKRTFLVLWGLVMLRLLIPFQVSSKVSIYNLVPNNNQVFSPIIPAINTTTPILDIPPIPLTINSAVNNISPITIVWVAGILLILLCTTFVYIRSMRNMKTSLPCENTFVENWLQSIPLKRKIQVRIFDRIKTPLTYGLIHPVILLPKNMDYSNEHQLLAILTHEYIHIKRFDNIKKIIMVFTLSIHWFNPLVWVMFVLCNRDIELACDEKVLLDLGHDTRVTYALTLVELSEQCNAFSLTSGFSKNALEERVKAIMKHKKMTAFTVAIVIVLIVGVTTVFATSKSTENVEAEYLSGTMDGKNYIYSQDGGKSWITEEEHMKENPELVESLEFWEIEEFKNWVKVEKTEYQKLVDNKESFYDNQTGKVRLWTQLDIDELFAIWDEQIISMGKGYQHTKPIKNSDGSTMVGVFEPETKKTSTASSAAVITLDDGQIISLGEFPTLEEADNAVKDYLDEQVEAGTMTRGESDNALKNKAVE